MDVTQGAKAAIRCTKASGYMYLQCNDGSVPHHWPGINVLKLFIKQINIFLTQTVGIKLMKSCFLYNVLTFSIHKHITNGDIVK